MYGVHVRTTLNVDDDVLLAAKQRAAVAGVSVGEALSAMAREAMSGRSSHGTRNGVPLISHADHEVTPETVQSLLDEVT